MKVAILQERDLKDAQLAEQQRTLQQERDNFAKMKRDFAKDGYSMFGAANRAVHTLLSF
jgi:hypothetical protein